MIMIKKLKKLPKFKSEDEEREFWATHSSMDYVDWSKAKRAVLPNLKRSKHLIPVTVSELMYEKLSKVAKQQDKPLADVARHYLQQGLRQATAGTSIN
jgi:hypothetical protein